MKRRSLLAGLAAACAVPSAALGRTPRMVTGPFPPEEFHPELFGRPNPGARRPVGEHDMDLAQVEGQEDRAKGQVVVVQGRVLAGSDRPVEGAEIEIWQADHAGHYNHENERRTVGPSDLDPGFGYWGSTRTGADGRFTLRTIVPGTYPASRDWTRPPHLHWTVGAQGLGEVTTQSFFEGDVLQGIETIRELNRVDPILHFGGGFARGLSSTELTRARKTALEELLVRFAPGEGGTPTGELILRLVP